MESEGQKSSRTAGRTKEKKAKKSEEERSRKDRARENLQLSCSKAYSQYAQAIVGSRQESYERWREAWTSYVRALQEVHEETQRALDDAYSEYCQAVNESWGQPDAAESAQRAYYDYWKAVCEIRSSSETLERSHQAGKSYAEAVQTANEKASESLDEAYRAYLDGLRQAWADADFQELQPGALMSVVQTMGFGAYVAHHFDPAAQSC